MTTKTTSIRIPEETLEEIDEKCQKDGISRNDFIKSAIEAALEKDDDVVPELKVISIDGVPVKSKIVGIEY